MIDLEKLQDILAEYKRDFPQRWPLEKYKWEAVRCFQTAWDFTARDFEEMFTAATARTKDLLTSVNYYPRGVMRGFAAVNRDATKAMFANLFDEKKNLAARVERFREDAEHIRREYGEGIWKQHYQKLNAISIYLWLRYPDRYYLYNYSDCRVVAKELHSSFMPHRGAHAGNLIGAYELFDEICDVIKKDRELQTVYRAQRRDNCWADTSCHTLTVDLCMYISRIYSKKGIGSGDLDWLPIGYSPELSVQDWVALLQDDSVFTESSLEVMRRFLDFGGMATCRQLANKYGEPKNFYDFCSVSLAKRVAEKTDCNVLNTEDERAKWWPILYVGKIDEKDAEGGYIWKLRDELAEALRQVDLSRVNLYANVSLPKGRHAAWWFSVNPVLWSFSSMGVGEPRSFSLYNENGNKRRIFENFLEVKSGDFLICYESLPVRQIVAIGKIVKESDGENIYLEKVEGLVHPIGYNALQAVRELRQMEYFENPQGNLFKLTHSEYTCIMDLIRDENPVDHQRVVKPYTSDDFIREVYMSRGHFATLISLLKHKQNIILQGAPGVGKTYTARRIAYAMMKERDDSRIEFVHFHESFGYDDFVAGYKPQDTGYVFRYGVFYRFCQRAANMPNKPFFFIIDDINRGNISKIFGELLMLIEKPYRGTAVTLSCNGMPFSVPKNIYIIGMMNMADNVSIRDYILRRRFGFFELIPEFDSDGFQSYMKRLDSDTFTALIACIKKLNAEIAEDPGLGRGFCIGHGYFCGQTEYTEEWLMEIVDYEIMPLLSEYWPDNPDKVRHWGHVLRSVFYD